MPITIMTIKLSLEEARTAILVAFNRENVLPEITKVEISLPAVAPTANTKSATLSDWNVYQLVECGQKILAIKLMREITSEYIGLAETKKKVESIHSRVKAEEVARKKYYDTISPAF
jgi:ribosomal protein L7/L12